MNLNKINVIIKRMLSDKKWRKRYILSTVIGKQMSDTLYLKCMYSIRLGKKLNLKNPKTFNEKLQWLKLHDRNPLYTTMVDKYAAKKYVADKIGEEYIIPTLGVWDKFDDIDFDSLPNQFVLKCTHDSGGLVICKDKDVLDREYAKQKIEKSLKKNYYYRSREWPYKNVKPRIIAEKFMNDDKNDELIDYKMMCFHSKVKATFTCTGRRSKNGLRVTFYDTDWNRLPFERHYPASDVDIEKPKNYQEMVELAEKLSENISFVRVDFYEIQGKVYFGEMTFYPGGGFEEFTPDTWDYEFGKMLKLPEGNKG